MINQKELNLLEKGEKIEHFLLLKKCEIRLTKANKQYLLVELGDKSLTLSANIWENFELFYKSVIPGDVVKVSGNIDEYQGTPQIKVFSISKAPASSGVSPEDFLPRSRRDFNEMKKEFFSRMEKISNAYLKQLMKQIFNEENFKKYSKVPAGKAWHHAYIHGLLEHTLEIIKICDLMSGIHPEINNDLLVCGAMMHDFGKTEELSFDGAFDYTDKGKLLGHIVISAMYVNEESKKISNFPNDLKECLLHIILSHQGKLEYASPVVPKTLEAITLYQADELSAKVNAYKSALALGTSSDNKWTKYLALAATDLFNHGLLTRDDSETKTLFD
jgi:3'-5' exoribonuclease